MSPEEKFESILRTLIDHARGRQNNAALDRAEKLLDELVEAEAAIREKQGDLRE